MVSKIIFTQWSVAWKICEVDQYCAVQKSYSLNNEMVHSILK